MLYKCSDIDKPKIFEYIGNDYKNCLYAYADIYQYSMNETFINAWFDKDCEGSIKCLIFNYHTAIHIFSKDLSFDKEALKVIIDKVNPTMINARREIIEIIAPYFNGYKREYGYILKGDNMVAENSSNIELAKPSDYHKMAVMLCNDHSIGASYTLTEMEKQLRERIEDGFCRSYVLRKDGIIVAQASTGAEVDKFATIVYVIVDPNYRRQGLATQVTAKLCNELSKEGRESFLVCYEEGARIMYENLGFKVCSECGKLYLEINKKI